jgi:hypothetical protein
MATETKPSAVEQAIERRRAAQAAYDLVEVAGDDDTITLRTNEEYDAIDNLVEAPCVSDAEFIEKLRLLIAYEISLFGSPFDSKAEFCIIARAVATHLAEAA